MNPPHQRPRNSKIREKRVLRHLPLVRTIARGLRPTGPCVEVDDLVSAGTIGLIEAVDRYDARRGVPFGSFAYSRIRGAIIDEMFRFVSKSARQLASEPLSLEAPILEQENLTLKDVTVDPNAPEPDRSAELTELLEAVRALPRRERQMLGLAAAGHTVSEIARLHGCSQSRASELLAQARFRLDERTAA
jgi:RNA polymerase sigma factor (sigma-70 family)